jgi:phage terminase large subunit
VTAFPIEGLREALAQAELAKLDPKRFVVYRGRELDFLGDVFGIRPWSPDDPDTPGLTPDQVKLFKAIFAHRRVTCRSGHMTGKSFVLALAAITWLYVWAGAVVTTATTWNQVEGVLWKEIRLMISKARVHLPREKGHPLQTELKVQEDIYAIGLSTNDPTAFQGRHHARLLVIVDEAAGVPDPIHEAVRSLAGGKHNHIVLVGNPTVPTGAFARSHKKGSWFRLRMSCLDHPNVILGREIIPGAASREYVESEREDYGENSPVYQARVLGEFPTVGEDIVIPLAWLERQTDNAKRAEAIRAAEEGFQPWIMALDVARYGSNKCVLVFRRGQAVVRIESWANESTMTTVGRVVMEFNAMIEQGHRVQAIVVDEVGLGGGVVDRLLELGLPVLGFHSGRPPAKRTLFSNRRAESWWDLRDLVEPDKETGHGKVWLPPNEQLLTDLSGPKYKLTSNGKIVVESKEDMRARGVQSPDFGDAVIMAFAIDGMPEIPVPPRDDRRDYTEFEPIDPDKANAEGFPDLLGSGW